MLALIVFSLAVFAAAWWIARRDVLVAAFVLFFWLYTILAMVGYRFFPILSWALRLYFGEDVYVAYFRFVALSFTAFVLFFALFRSWLFRPGRFAVDYRGALGTRLVVFPALGLFLLWMTYVFRRDYALIDYTVEPSIPDKLFSIGFKQMPFVNLALYAFARLHARTAFERCLAVGLLAPSLVLFFSIASRSGNRTDILATLLGLSMYELFPRFTNARGGLRLSLDARRVGVLAGTALVAGVALVAMFRIQVTRTEGTTGLPLFALVLYNDYYTPAHMLFAALGLNFIDPYLVLKSNVANALFLGRLLDVPYLQTVLGNIVAPGSSTRSASFGFYIFTEGYMAMGPWGFLYNGLVPLFGIAAWRALASSTDARFNAYAAGLIAMGLANVTRSGSILLVRNLYFFLVPAVLLFAALTGARRGVRRLARAAA